MTITHILGPFNRLLGEKSHALGLGPGGRMTAIKSHLSFSREWELATPPVDQRDHNPTSQAVWLI